MKGMAMAAVSIVRSIQGEIEKIVQETLWADQAEVDVFVEKVSETVLACRERGRHLFPVARKSTLHFTRVDEFGRLVREMRCECCALVVRVEHWEEVGRGRSRRFTLVGKTLRYETGAGGERYTLPPGHGRIKPRQVQESVMQLALDGLTLSEIRKQLQKVTPIR
jgi:hypothetical protein